MTVMWRDVGVKAVRRSKAGLAAVSIILVSSAAGYGTYAAGSGLGFAAVVPPAPVLEASAALAVGDVDGSKLGLQDGPEAPVVAPPTSVPTTTTPPASAAPSKPLAPKAPIDSAPSVRSLQQRLNDLGYWLGTPDGSVGPTTQQAVYAFQKVEGLPRTGRLDAATTKKLRAAKRPAASIKGDGVEIDKSSQVIFIVRAGKVRWTFNTSTGTEKRYQEGGRTGVAHTPVGRFTVAWQVDAIDPGPLGALYRPKYFTPDGVAVHGAAHVPPYPASHGCARVGNAAMDFVWSENLMPLGSTVVVHA